jgi:hypothetical protein
MRVESLLASVVMLDKIIIRKYWPAYKAVAKLRYKAAILEIKGV